MRILNTSSSFILLLDYFLLGLAIYSYIFLFRLKTPSNQFVMRIAETHYTLGTFPVTGIGLGVSKIDLDIALAGSVASLVFDDAGNDEIEVLLGGVTDTEFDKDNLDKLLHQVREPEAWRVGEAIAEHYLSECRSCHFPWPDGRDERKRGSSLPGADLVGFQNDGESEHFAFGEVKTSAEYAYPPSAVYGRHGLKQQMEDIRDRSEIRDDLVRYLAHRAVNATWKDRFKSAAINYLRDNGNVRIFGLLVRDVPPDADDLRIRVHRLGQNCPASMVIELLAIHLPEGRITSLGSQVMRNRQGGGAR
jgi:hypothetical protein